MAYTAFFAATTTYSLLSDLRSRATPFLVQVHSSVPVGAQRNAAISQVYKAVLQKIIDEELEEKAASQAKVVVSAREVDEAIERVATQNRITSERLLAEAGRESERVVIRPVYGLHLKQILITMGGMIIAEQMIMVL